MQYTLIKGKFHVVGFSPDGDSMMFKADNPALWQALEGNGKALFEKKLALEKNQGAVQLRLQGIDALETHYSPPPLRTPSTLSKKASAKQTKPVAGGYHQPDAIGQMATNKFLNILGVDRVEWRKWGKTTWIDRACFKEKGTRGKKGKETWVDDKFAEVITGYIVTSEVEKNGRPLAWIFAGKTTSKEGELTKNDLAKRLKDSVNYQLLKYGLVYPYFYASMAGVLRKKMITATKMARSSAKRKQKYLAKKPSKAPEKVANLWFYDKSDEGIKIADLHTLTEHTELYPYLFRKTVKTWYRQQMQHYWQSIEGNKRFTFDADDKKLAIEGLLDDGNPRVFDSSEQDFVRLSEIMELKNGTLKLLRNPMDLVFL